MNWNFNNPKTSWENFLSGRLRELFSLLLVLNTTLFAAIPSASLDRREPVNFERELLPAFRANCLACHNQTKAKAGLILETPATIRQGSSSGPVVVPGNPDESLLFRAASHLDEDSVMPPVGNQSNAKNLTPEQLGLLRLWIVEGARGEVADRSNIVWQPVPQRVRPIYSVALTPLGRYVAYGRGSEVVVYEIPLRKTASRLRDPNLSGRRSHLDLVHSIAFHPGGNWIATGGFREVKLWEREVSAEAFSLGIEPNDSVTAIGLSGDRLVLGLGFQSGQVRSWELSTNKLLLHWRGKMEPVRQISLSSDGSRVAVVFEGGTLKVIAVAGGGSEKKTPETRDARLSCWGNSSHRLAVAVLNGLELWKQNSMEDFEREQRIEGNEIVGLAASSGDGRFLTMAEQGGRVRLFDWETGHLKNELNLKNPISQCLLLSNRGNRIAVAAADGNAGLWNTISKKQTASLRGARKEQKQVAKRERLLRLFEGSSEMTKKQTEDIAKELKKETEREVKAETDLAEKKAEADKALQKREAAKKAYETANKKVKQLQSQLDKAEQSFKTAQSRSEKAAGEAKELAKQLRQAAGKSPDSAQRLENIRQKVDQAIEKLVNLAFAAGQAKSNLERITTESGEEKKKAADEAQTAQKTLATEEANWVKAQQLLSIAEHELQLAEKSVEQRKAQSLQAVQSLREAEASVAEGKEALSAAQSRLQTALSPFCSLDLSPDGRRIVALEPKGRLSVWQAETGEELDYVSLKSPHWIAARFLTELSILAVDENGNCRVVSLDTKWTLRRTWGEEFGFVDRVNALAFSADGKWLASGGGEPSRSGEIKVWNWETMELVHDLETIHSDSVSALEFSPDAQYLASGSADRFVRVVDLASGRTKHSMEGHTHHVLDVSWQADGRALVSAGADAVVKIWDAVTGERKRNIEGFKKEATGVGFLGNKAEVLASSGDATIAVYGLDGKRRRVMEGARGFIFAESVSADGRYVAGGGQDGVLRIWDAPSGKALVTVTAEASD